MLKYFRKQRVAVMLLSYVLSFDLVLTPISLYAQPPQIIVDGRTQTTLDIQGKITNVHTNSISGGSAYNSFSKFDVYSGNTVNLHVPNSVNNLINLVRDQKTNIDGILNSYKNGAIGGDVYFLNPHGIIIGKDGTVNTGSLTMTTPTQKYMDGFLNPSGIGNAASLRMLRENRIPLSEGGLISIEGKVNAVNRAALSAAQVNVSGQVISGAEAKARISFTDIVNQDGIEHATQASINPNGEIQIFASNDVVVTGRIAAEGTDDKSGGTVDVRASNDIELKHGSQISAKGNGVNSDGGDVVVFADNRSTFEEGAKIDVSGGAVSGDGGFAELSAKKDVALRGGTFRAGAENGKAGSVLIDPENLTISSNQSFDAATYTFQADNKITVEEDVVISSQQTTKDSGNLIFEANEIELKNGSQILADNTSGYNAGDVSLTVTASTGFLNNDIDTGVLADGAIIKGRNVTITATSSVGDPQIGFDLASQAIADISLANTTIEATNNVVIGATATQGEAYIADTLVDARKSKASVELTNVDITATGGQIALASTSSMKTDVSTLGGFSPVQVAGAVTESSASTKILGTSNLSASGDVSVTANADTESRVIAERIGSSNGVTSALSIVTNKAEALIAGTTTITDAATVTVQAEGRANVQTIADAAVGGGSSGSAIAVSVSHLESTSSAQIADGASIANSDNVQVLASSLNQSITGARAGGVPEGENATPDNAPSENATSVLGNTLDNPNIDQEQSDKLSGSFNDEVGSTQGNLTSDEDAQSSQIAGAISYSNIENDTLAAISTLSDAAINSTGAVLVESQAVTQASSLASGKPGDGAKGGGAGVAVMTANNLNRALVQSATGSLLSINAGNGLAVKAKTASIDQSLINENTNKFGAIAYSGSGGGNVGFAGALGIVDTDINEVSATVGANVSINAGAGDVSVEAIDNTESKVVADGALDDDDGSIIDAVFDLYNSLNSDDESNEDETDDDSGALGIGASVAVNVTNNKTMATVDGTANLSNVGALNVEARGTSVTETQADSAGAGGISLVPVVALSVANDQVRAALETSDAAISAAGAVKVTANQNVTVNTLATGAAGDEAEAAKVAVGMSVALGISTSSSEAVINRDITAMGDLSVQSKGVRTTSSGAVSGINGAGSGEDDESDDAPGGEEVDAISTLTSIINLANVLDNSSGNSTDADSTTGNVSSDADKDEKDSEAKLGLGAAFGIGVTNATTEAIVKEGRALSGATVTILSEDLTNAEAQADGSSAEAAMNVGGGVAVNIANVRNSAIVEKNVSLVGGITDIIARTVKIVKLDENGDPVLDDDGNIVYVDETSTFNVAAQAGAGAGNIKVAGAAAINVISNKVEALVQTGALVTTTGDLNVLANSKAEYITAGVGVAGGKSPSIRDMKDEYSSLKNIQVKIDQTAQGLGDLIDVKRTATGISGGASDEPNKDSKLGIGMSFAVSAVNETIQAKIADSVLVKTSGSGSDLLVSSTAVSNVNVTSEAGASTSIELGEQSEITAYSLDAAVAVNVLNKSSIASIGTAATSLSEVGANTTIKAISKTDALTTSDGEAAGDIAAAGASVSVAVIKDDADASLMRSLTSGGNVTIAAQLNATDEAIAEATARGQVIERYMNMYSSTSDMVLSGDFGNEEGGAKKSRSTQALDDSGASTKSVDKDGKEDSSKSKSISFAAAVGVNILDHDATAQTADGITINSGGDFSLTADSDANFSTRGSGLAVLTDTAIGVGVAVANTVNNTEARLGANNTINQSTGVTIASDSQVNQSEGYRNKLAAQALAGAGGSKTGVAGALAVVNTVNTTKVNVGSGSTLVSSGDVTVSSSDLSKITTRAAAAAVAINPQGEAKGGVGASFSVIVANNNTEAKFSENVTVDADGAVNVTARNKQQSDDIFDFSGDFDAENITAPFQNVNYYTESAAGAGANGKLALAGSFSVVVTNNKTNALVDKGSSIDGSNVAVEASNDNNVRMFGGAIGIAKGTGIGVTVGAIVNTDMVSAKVGSDNAAATIAATGDVSVKATGSQDVGSILVAGGVGEGGAAGSFAFNVFQNDVLAEIDQGSNVSTTGGNIGVVTTNDTEAKAFTGGLGGGTSKTGVGGALSVNVMANTTRSRIDNSAILNAAGQTNVTADAKEDILAATIGLGFGDKAAAIVAANNTIVSITEALVNTGVKINENNDADGVAQNVTVRATDKTDIANLSTGVALSSNGSGAAAIDTNVIAKTVTASVDGLVKADTDVKITADTEQNVSAISIGGAGGTGISVGGSVGVGIIKSETLAIIGSNAEIVSKGNVALHAEDETDVFYMAGAVSVGGKAAIGISVGVNTFVGVTKAEIQDGAEVTALGNSAPMKVMTGDVSLVSPIIGAVTGSNSDTIEDEMNQLGERVSNLNADSLDAIKTAYLTKDVVLDDRKGLSVTSYSDQDLLMLSAAGGASAGVSVAGSMATGVLASITEASIGKNVTINGDNSGAGVAQDVVVRATTDANVINAVGGVALGAKVGVGGAVNVMTVVKNTRAYIDQSSVVKARQDVSVTADAEETMVQTAINVAGGVAAGVGLSTAVGVVANTTEAYIKGKVNAGRDLEVSARDEALMVQVAGQMAFGAKAGVGASIGVTTFSNTTQAYIDQVAVTNAGGKTLVEADSKEEAYSVVVAGSGGGVAGVAGALRMGVHASTTQAWVAGSVNQDASFAQSGQSIEISADNLLRVVGLTGAIGIGITAAGVAGSADISVVRNNANAFIGAGSVISAQDDITIKAASKKELVSFAMAGAGAFVAGVAGAVSVAVVGGIADDDTKSHISGDEDEGEGNDWDTANNASSGDNLGGSLGDSDSSMEAKSIVDAQDGKAGVNDNFNATEEASRNDTKAFIGRGATVVSGRDVNVAANDTNTLVTGIGVVSVGKVGVGGGATVGVVDSSAQSYISADAKVDVARTLDLDAKSKDTTVMTAVSAGGGFYASVRGATAITTVTSEAKAYIGDGAEVNQSSKDDDDEQSVNVNAESVSDVVSVVGSGGGAIVGVGYSSNVLTIDKTTQATIGKNALVKAKKNILVDATSDDSAVVVDMSLQGGGLGIGGVTSVNTMVSKTDATIDEGAVVFSEGNVRVQAVNDTELDVIPVSVAIGGVSISGVSVVNTIATLTKASVKTGAQVTALATKETISVYTGAGTRAASNEEVVSETDGTNEEDGSSIQQDAINVDRSQLTRTQKSLAGLAVVAQSDQDVTSVPTSGGASYGGSLSGLADVEVIATETYAGVADGVTINADNTGAGSNQQVTIAAYDKTISNMILSSVNVSVMAANAITAHTGVIAKNVKAELGGSTQAKDDVSVIAEAEQSVVSSVANANVSGGGSGSFSISTDVVSNIVLAEVRNSAIVKTHGDLRVDADETTNFDKVIGQLAGGLVAGVGAGIGVTTVSSDIKARIGLAAQTDANGLTKVAATSSQEVKQATISGGAGVGFAVQGALGVQVVTVSTQAEIDNGALINQNYTSASQDVSVLAENKMTVESAAGAGAAGGVAAAGVGINVAVARNTTAARIGANSKVKAARSVTVKADAEKDLQSTGIAGAASIIPGGLTLAGSVSIAVLGGEASEQGKDQLGADNGGFGDEVNQKAGANYSADMDDGDNKTSQAANTEQSQSHSKSDVVEAKTQNLMAPVNASGDDLADTTAAVIDNGAVVVAGEDISLLANDKTRVRSFAGGVSMGAIALGGWVSTATLNTDTRARVGSSANLSAGDDVLISATQEDKDGASEAQAIGGSASYLVGAGITSATLVADNETSAAIGANTQINEADKVTVLATRNTSTNVDAIGASAGFGSAGIAVANLVVTGDTDAELEDGVVIGTVGGETGDVTVAASTKVDNNSQAKAASAGVIGSVAGALSTLTYTGRAKAYVGNNVKIRSTGSVQIAANDNMVNKASSIGASLGGGISGGVSSTVLTVNRDAISTTGDNASLEGSDISITADMEDEGGDTAVGSAIAGSGGLLVGLAGTLNVVTVNTDAKATTGTGTSLIDNDDSNSAGVTVAALNKADTDGQAIGVSAGGLYAAGGHSSIVTAVNSSTARLGGNATVGTEDALLIKAKSQDNTIGRVISGAGGAAVIQAGIATVTHVSNTKAETADSTSLSDIEAGSVEIIAQNSSKYDGALDATGVAIAQNTAGALVVTGVVNADASLGNNTGAKTHNFDMVANNAVSKNLVSGTNYKVLQGGLLNVGVGVSVGTLVANSNAKVGDGAQVVVTGSKDDIGNLNISALNAPTVDDEAKIDSGGAISVPLASTVQTVTLSTATTLGTDAKLETEYGDISLNARSDADADVRAYATTYGLAGAGMGSSIAIVNANDKVTIGNNASVSGIGNVNLRAGVDANGEGQLDVKADTDVYNKTLFAVTSKPIADATASKNAMVTIASGATIGAARDVNLQSSKGGLNANGKGVATDLSKKAVEAIAGLFGIDVPAEIKGGNSRNSGSAGLQVDGTVETGIRNKLSVTFGDKFNTYYKSGSSKAKRSLSYDASKDEWKTSAGVVLAADNQSDGISWTILKDQDLSGNLKDEINRLKTVRAEYGAKTDINGVLNSEAQRVAGEIDDRLVFLEAQLASRNGNDLVDIIQVNPAEVMSGNVKLWGDYVAGSGTIKSPNDAEIVVTNKSSMPMQIQGLDIAKDAGGDILFNGRNVSNNSDVLARNGTVPSGTNVGLTLQDSQSSSAPQIIVESKFDPASGVYNPTAIPDIGDPDIIIAGDINNINGLARISNEAGSILANANVRADTVEVSTSGDFVFDDNTALYNVGADPEAAFKTVANSYEAGAASTGSQSGVKENSSDSFLIAGNNVFINADTVNINGTIQSGLAYKAISVSQAEVDAANASGVASGQRYVKIGSTTEQSDGAVASTSSSDYLTKGGISAELDRDTNEILIRGAEVKGGSVIISGQIASTGAGNINVMDGYGRIEVNNDSTSAVRIDAMDTGDIEGEILLIDKAKDNGRGRSLVTRYTRLGNDVQTYNNWDVDSAEASVLVNTSAGTRSSTYNPNNDLRYNWMTGTETQTKTHTLWRKQKKSIAGVIPIGNITLSSSDIQTGYPIVEDIPKDDLPQGDYVGERTGADYTYSRQKVVTQNDITNTSGGSQWDELGVVGTITVNPCAPWTTCNVSQDVKGWVHYTQRWKRTNVDNITETHNYHSVNAGHSVNINFIGNDKGSINVASKGSVHIAGSINNLQGTTNLTSSAGDIVNVTTNANLKTDVLTLSASGSVGAVDSYLQLAQAGGASVSISAGDNMYVQSSTGDLNISALTTGAGSTGLIADRNLVTANAGIITGKNIYLEAKTGAIGSTGKIVQIDTDAANGGTFIAIANKGDLSFEEVSGDLRVKQVETLGDVALTVDGSIVDANIEEVEDTQTITELRDMWNGLDLLGQGAEDKKAAQVAGYERSQVQAYNDYWAVRNGSDDANTYDANFVYAVSTNERQSLSDAGLDGTAIDTYASMKTNSYHKGFENFGDTAFDVNFTYTATSGEVADLTSGYKWTESELTNALPSLAFKDTTDTTTRIENANVIGNNVAINVGGHIGSEKGSIVLDLTTSNDLTDEVKVALAAAERDDIIRADTTLTIQQKEDFDIDAKGSINLSAQNHIFLGSENDVNAYSVVAGQNLRVKVGGAINNARDDGGINFQSEKLILEAAAGAIGSALKPIMIEQVDGKALVARAAKDIFLTENTGDMYVDAVFSQSNVTLRSPGRIIDWAQDEEMDVSAENITLEADGDIGQAGGHNEALEVAITQESGRLALTSTNGGANLFAPARQISLGKVSLNGALNVKTGTGLVLHDDVSVSTGGVTLNTLGDLNMDNISSVNAGDGVISLKAGGRVQLTGLTTSNATAQAVSIEAGTDIVDGGDDEADITATHEDAIVTLKADKGIGSANHLETSVSILKANNITDGNVQLVNAQSIKVDVGNGLGDISLQTTSGDLGVGTLTTSGLVNLVVNGSVVNKTSGPSSITGTEISMKAETGRIGTDGQNRFMIDTIGRYANISADQGIYLSELNGDFNAASIVSNTGDAMVRVANGNASIGEISAPEIVDVEVNGDRLEITKIDPNVLKLQANGAIKVAQALVGAQATFIGDDIQIDQIDKYGESPELTIVAANKNGINASNIEMVINATEAVKFDRLHADQAVIKTSSNNLGIVDGAVQAYAALSSSSVKVQIGKGAPGAFDVTLSEAKGSYKLNMFGTKVKTDASLLFSAANVDVTVEGAGSEGSATDVAAKASNTSSPSDSGSGSSSEGAVKGIKQVSLGFGSGSQAPIAPKMVTVTTGALNTKMPKTQDGAPSGSSGGKTPSAVKPQSKPSPAEPKETKKTDGTSRPDENKVSDPKKAKPLVEEDKTNKDNDRKEDEDKNEE